jgi:hypothetical protein
MFSIEDEAFGLILVHNEVERWIDQLEEDSAINGTTCNGEKDDLGSIKTNKKFCDPKSGNRDGWTKEGIELFNYLCGAVQKLRNDNETGCILEAKLRQKFVGIKENTTDVSRPEVDDRTKKRRRTTYRCDWADKQFEDYGEVEKFNIEEPQRSQQLESREITLFGNANMSEKMNNTVVFEGPEDM